MKNTLKLTIVILIGSWLMFCAGCEGPEGPMGPQGLVGPAGPAGADGVDGEDGTDGADGEDGAGTRVVYTSNGVIPDMLEWYFLIPEITLDDLPLVAVYSAWEGTPNEWTELPIFVEGFSGDGQFYYLTEGRVNVYNCAGLWIKIVVVI